MIDFSLSVRRRVHDFLATIVCDTLYHGFEKQLLREVKLENVCHGNQEITFSMTVQETMCNKDGFLHGGAATTLLDNLSSTALIFIQGEGFWHNFGVTRTFTMVFHKGVAQGERIYMRCSVVAVGKKMATVQAALFNSGGSKCVTCLHDKFAVETSKL